MVVPADDSKSGTLPAGTAFPPWYILHTGSVQKALQKGKDHGMWLLAHNHISRGAESHGPVEIYRKLVRSQSLLHENRDLLKSLVDQVGHGTAMRPEFSASSTRCQSLFPCLSAHPATIADT